MPRQRTKAKAPQNGLLGSVKGLHVPEGGLTLTSTFVVAGLATLGIATLLATRSNSAPSMTKLPKPQSTSKLSVSSTTKKATVAAVAAKSAPATAAPAVTDSTGRRTVAFYTGDVRDTMFSEPLPPAPPAIVVHVDKPAPVVVPPYDPWAEWKFTGIATVDDAKIAIMENIETHESQFVKVGENFQGKVVVDIDKDSLYVKQGTKPLENVMMSMNRSYIPLSKSADYMTAQPQNPQGQKGMDMQQAIAAMMAAQNGNGNGKPGYQFPGANGQPLTGADARNQKRNLNRNFNDTGAGGGGGATGFPGGGGGGGGRRGGRGGGG